MNYHDVLSRLGIKNAHPGGAQATDAWMKRVSVPENAKVLDVGCGNGATACRAASFWNADVTVLDIRPAMIRNALKLAQRQGVTLQAVTGSAEALPFGDDSFDFIICESVLVFVKLAQTLREFRRVLKPNGQIIDVEMMVLRPVSEEWHRDVGHLYGAVQVPDLSVWKQHFSAAGFSCQVIRSGRLTTQASQEEQLDEFLLEGEAFYDPQVFSVMEANGRWMEQNANQMGYGIFLLSNAHAST